MRDYLKALAIISTLFALAGSGTALNTPERSLDLARAAISKTVLR